MPARRDPGAPLGLNRIGQIAVLAGGVIAGVPLVAPAATVVACSALGRGDCATDSPIILGIIPVYILAVAVVVWRMAIGGSRSLLLGAVATLAVAINSVTDLLASERTGAGLPDGLIVAGAAVMLLGCACRLAAGGRSGTVTT